jgi:peroxiredoxin (alkyl hydroperoxide reductase subunit C)
MLVTKEAPDFTATAVMPNNSINDNFNLYENLGENGAVLFFYPLDFTFVCPTEIITFNKKLDEFKKRGVNVIGVSIDSQFSHLAWKNTEINNGGIGQVQYPLVADLDKSISKAYDVLLNESVALRASFLIDSDKIIRHAVINDLPLGRNIDEMLRMVDAVNFTNKHGEVCPAGWQEGEEAMKPNPEGVAEYLSKHADEL